MELSEVNALFIRIKNKEGFFEKTWKPWGVKITDVFVIHDQGNYRITFKYENGKENSISEFLKWHELDLSFFDN